MLTPVWVFHISIMIYRNLNFFNKIYQIDI